MIAKGNEVPDFSLNSSWGETFSTTEHQKELLICVFGVQKTLKTISSWYKELTERYKGNESVQVLAIAILNQLPSFVPHVAVSAKLKRTSDIPLFMDFDGKLAQSLEISTDSSSVLLIYNNQAVSLLNEVNDDLFSTVNQVLNSSEA